MQTVQVPVEAVASASAGLRLEAGDDPVEWVLYAGALLLLLAYVGSRFVLEVVLGKAT